MPKNPLCLSIILACCLSCAERDQNSSLTIRLSAYPDSFSPISSSAVSNLESSKLVFEHVNKFDSTGRVVPHVASDFSQTVLNDTLSLFRFRINDSARWANGQPIGFEDIALTLKLSKTPLMPNGTSIFSLAPLHTIEKDTVDERVFNLVITGNPDYAKMISGDFQVIPEHIFDSLHIWRKYEMAYVSSLTEATAPPELLQYAAAYKALSPYSQKFFEGSGPYKIDAFVPDQSISLSLRDDWWKEVPSHRSLPKRISMVAIPDATAARFALQNGEIDLMTQIPATEFIQLEKFNAGAHSLNLYRQAGFRFIFLGFNTRVPKFSDSQTRVAIASLLDIPAIIDAVKLGYADATVGPVHPVLKELYNDLLQQYSHDTARSTRMLREAGWRYSEGGWVRNGEKLAFDLKFNGANKDYEKIALIVSEAASKVGIKVGVEAEESSSLNQELKAHQFEAVIWSFVGSPTAFNFSPLFHSDATAPGHLNFTGFATPESDRAIEAALVARTKQEMGEHLKVLQQTLHDECPMIFLYFEQSLIATSKKFPKMNITYYRPGYDPVGVF